MKFQMFTLNEKKKFVIILYYFKYIYNIFFNILFFLLKIIDWLHLFWAVKIYQINTNAFKCWHI